MAEVKLVSTDGGGWTDVKSPTDAAIAIAGPPEAYKTVPRRVCGLDGQIRGAS
jgi:hypothetical protein